MAKDMKLADALQKMIDDARRAGAVAALLIKDKVKEDFEKAARGSVDKYYEYKNGSYTKYGRQHHLYNIYKINTKVSSNGDSWKISADITMSSSWLNGLYQSNSSEHQGSGAWSSGGQVSGSYVFQNFIKGKHPWTNGWPKGNVDDLRYKLIKYNPSPDKFLSDYMGSYGPKYLDKHFNNAIADLIGLYS